MTRLLVCTALLFALDAAAVTVDNDDSCDISVLPAATLLLPYFEVDLEDINGETTLFTVTNVTSVDQIVQVTLWTDYAYPVLSFPLFLTGYDVQSINLFDVISRGIIAPPSGTGWNVRMRGAHSRTNPARNVGNCNFLPGVLDSHYTKRMQDAFTDGSVDDLGILPGCQGIGGIHQHAVGYATLDVVGECSTAYPLDQDYWTELIRYENVLIGDYQQVNGIQSSAQGGPLVHIRAIPEGGTPQQRASLFEYDAEFDRTFYSQYQPAATPHLDGRQPLPAQFATRWINGGTSAYETSFKIWREGVAGENAACAAYGANAAMEAGELVVFDEHENASVAPQRERGFPATSRTAVGNADFYPQLASGVTSGWMYLNLDRPGDDYASQNWVISSMRALGRFSTDTDAIALGNGCSLPERPSEITRLAGAPIGPAPNSNGNEDDEVSTQNDDSCDIAALPAATLLLPYFEVDVESQSGETTLLTVTNVSAQDQIARVTLWTDLAFPVLSFNVFLTGYDVQSINLYDVLSRGVVETSNTPRGAYSESNPGLNLRSCDRLPGELDATVIARMQDAFVEGISAQCDEIGNVHDNAVGYATIDLVRNCGTHGPYEAEYWSDDLAYDNVLIGDYQQVHLANNSARSGELVHIRAIPEGGEDEAPFARTFYRRYQRSSSPKRDGRQPLPALFAARWIGGGPGAFATLFEIWRETATGSGAICGQHDDNYTYAVETVTFDEAENAWGDLPQCRCTPIFPETARLPATALAHIIDPEIFPQPTNGAVDGWVYMNLDTTAVDSEAHQNWVATTMSAQGRFSVSASAAALGNGCSAPRRGSAVTTSGGVTIGPAPNGNPR